MTIRFLIANTEEYLLQKEYTVVRFYQMTTEVVAAQISEITQKKQVLNLHTATPAFKIKGRCLQQIFQISMFKLFLHTISTAD